MYNFPTLYIDNLSPADFAASRGSREATKSTGDKLSIYSVEKLYFLFCHFILVYTKITAAVVVQYRCCSP